MIKWKLPMPTNIQTGEIQILQTNSCRTENKTEEKCDVVHEKECRTEFVREECHDDCKTEYDTVEKKVTEDRSVGSSSNLNQTGMIEFFSLRLMM